MLSVKLLDSEGRLHSGSEELIERWRTEHGCTIWIDIEQEPDEQERHLLTSFGCHELTINDAHRLRHPPKVEMFDEMTFILFRGIAHINPNLDITHLQLALFVGERFLITRHNTKAFSVEYWRSHSRLTHYLAHPALLAIQLLHFSSGKYLEQLLGFEEKLSDLEDIMQNHADDDILKELMLYKTRLRKLRRVFDYHQKVVELTKDVPSLPFPTGDIELKHRLQDLYERCERLHSLCSMYYEICGDLIEGYLSLSSHQLNITMRVLTVITAVFVPLSFIAGLYGMNFENIPELKYHYGYFIALGVMLSTATGLLLAFRKKHWI